MSSSSESSIAEWPDGLPAPLLDRRHVIAPRSHVTIMESKRKRVRRAHVEPIETIAAQWAFTEDQYSIFREFFITDLEQGSLPFKLVTFEPTSLPELTKVVTRILSFLDGTYSFSRSDNLFSVSAVLLIDLDGESVDFTALQESGEDFTDVHIVDSEEVVSICGDLLTFRFNAADAPDFSECWDIQIRYGGSLAWVGIHRRFSPIVLGWVHVKFENHYDGTLEVRAVHVCSLASGIYWGTAVRRFTEIPTIALPVIKLNGSSDSIEIRSFNKQAGQQIPTFRKFNPGICPDDHWTLVQYRRESKIGPGPTSFGPILKVLITHDDPGVEIRYTLDGTDPSLDVLNPGPYDGTYNTKLQLPPATCVIRARAYKDGCQSPVCILVLDKIIDTHYAVRVYGRVFSGAAWCYGEQFHRRFDDGLGGILGGDCGVQSRGCLQGKCCGDDGVALKLQLADSLEGSANGSPNGNLPRLPPGSVNLPIIKVNAVPINAGQDFVAIEDTGACNYDWRFGGSYRAGTGVHARRHSPISLILSGQWDNYPIGFFQGLILTRDNARNKHDLICGGPHVGDLLLHGFKGVFGPGQNATDWEEVAQCILPDSAEIVIVIEKFVDIEETTALYWKASVAVRTPYHPMGKPGYLEDRDCKHPDCGGPPLPPDVTSPSIVITQPAANFQTNVQSIGLEGVATDNVGVVSVTWSNDLGGSGVANLVEEDWFVTSVALADGTNTITVIATDTAGNMGTDTVVVERHGEVAYDNFDLEEVELAPLIRTLSGGFGFSAPWTLRLQILGVQASEDFERYDAENPLVQKMNLGWGFASPWVYRGNVTGLRASDNFESYAETSDIVVDLEAGTGFFTKWILRRNSTGIHAVDNFESYDETGDIVVDLNAGEGWASRWLIGASPH